MHAIAGIACALALAQDVAASEEAKRVWINANVAVSAGGEATIGELHGVRGSLAEQAKSALEKRRFVPASTGGKAVNAQGNLSANLVLTPRGDGYDVIMENLALLPFIKRIDPPVFPRRMFQARKSGYVELRVRITPQGGVDLVRTIAASDAAFERAARESIHRARFEAISTDEGPVASEVSIPYLFCYENQSVPDHEFVCALDGTQPQVEGQNGCVPTIEVVATSGYPSQDAMCRRNTIR